MCLDNIVEQLASPAGHLKTLTGLPSDMLETLMSELLNRNQGSCCAMKKMLCKGLRQLSLQRHQHELCAVIPVLAPNITRLTLQFCPDTLDLLLAGLPQLRVLICTAPNQKEGTFSLKCVAENAPQLRKLRVLLFVSFLCFSRPLTHISRSDNTAQNHDAAFGELGTLTSMHAIAALVFRPLPFGT